jgi:hypothetical protein
MARRDMLAWEENACEEDGWEGWRAVVWHNRRAELRAEIQ